MKYIDAEKLIDIIEKLESTFKKLEKTIGREDFFKGKREMAVQTRSIIKSLQQEQQVDLEKVLSGFIGRYAHENSGEYPSAIDIARHFYELGLKARKEEQI